MSELGKPLRSDLFDSTRRDQLLEYYPVPTDTFDYTFSMDINKAEFMELGGVGTIGLGEQDDISKI